MKLDRQDGVGILAIDTEHNNAVNPDFIQEAHRWMDEVEHDPTIRALVVTSTHKSVFCPGIDLPFLLTRSRTEMRAFFEGINGLAHRKFIFPKPEVYALNGHTIAAGCILALTGDYRLMTRGQFYFGLIEINLGMAVSAGMVEMLRHVLGSQAAERVLGIGENYLPDKAVEMGLVNEVVDGDMLMARALEQARTMGEKPQMAYRVVKRYAREAVAKRMRELDAAHVEDLINLWFSEDTQGRLTATLERLQKKKAG